MKKVILSSAILSMILATHLFSMGFMTEGKMNSVVIQIARANAEPKTDQTHNAKIKDKPEVRRMEYEYR
jgi:hypothetical protein